MLDIWNLIKTLLQSQAEVIAAFVVGAACAVMGVAAFRTWVFPRRDSDKELARKELEIARLDAELARRDAQAAGLEAKAAALEKKVRRRDDLIERLTAEAKRLQEASAANAPALAADDTACRERCAKLEAESAHSAKWLRWYEEEHARLSEIIAGAGLDREEIPRPNPDGWPDLILGTDRKGTP